MCSEQPFPKDHDPTDSSDTERLLSTEQSQEELLRSLQSTLSKRNKRLKTYLHFAAIVIYSAITLVLYEWSTRINGTKCECSSGEIYCNKTGLLMGGKEMLMR
jgi:hypothetical protein